MPWKDFGYTCEVQLLGTLIHAVYKVEETMGSSGETEYIFRN